MPGMSPSGGNSINSAAQSIQAYHVTIASLALAQAAASLAPALSQLAAANMQQYQQQQQQTEQLFQNPFAPLALNFAASSVSQAATTVLTPDGFAKHIFAPQHAQYQAQQQQDVAPQGGKEAVQQMPMSSTRAPAPASRVRTQEDDDAGTMLLGGRAGTDVQQMRSESAPSPAAKSTSKEDEDEGTMLLGGNDNIPPVVAETVENAPTPAPKSRERSKEEEDAGTMLLGFLTTLRKNHAAAMEKAREEEEVASKDLVDEAKGDNAKRSYAYSLGEVTLTPKAISTETASELSGDNEPTPFNSPSSACSSEGNNGTDPSIITSCSDFSQHDRGCINRSLLTSLSTLNKKPSKTVKALSKSNKSYKVGPARSSVSSHEHPSMASFGVGTCSSWTSGQPDATNSVNDRSSITMTENSSGSPAHLVDSSVGDFEASSSSSSWDNNFSRGHTSCGDGSDTGKTDTRSGTASSEEDSDNYSAYDVGPPKKRLKTTVGKFTSSNVAVHNSRMDALEGGWSMTGFSRSTPLLHPISEPSSLKDDSEDHQQPETSNKFPTRHQR